MYREKERGRENNPKGGRRSPSRTAPVECSVLIDSGLVGSGRDTRQEDVEGSSTQSRISPSIQRSWLSVKCSVLGVESQIARQRAPTRTLTASTWNWTDCSTNLCEYIFFPVSSSSSFAAEAAGPWLCASSGAGGAGAAGREDESAPRLRIGEWAIAPAGGFRVSGFGCGFWVSVMGFRFRLYVLGLRFSGLDFRVTGVEFRLWVRVSVAGLGTLNESRTWTLQRGGRISPAGAQR